LKDLSLDGRTILKHIFLKNWTGWDKLHSIALVKVDISCSIKCEECLD